MSFFSIVTNIDNGAGLQKDYELMRRMLEARGHRVHGEKHNANAPTLYSVDVVMFLEVIDTRWLGRGTEHWLIPNSEWWYDRVWGRFLPCINRVLCKTRDCEAIWRGKVGEGRCQYIGWEAPDLYQPQVARETKFLHLAGKSDTKNTASVVAAWREQGLPPLTIVAKNPAVFGACRNVPNVTVYEYLSEEQVVEALNSHRFFIMPSQYEGYGMALHEALGCGAVVLTTDAAPMNESAGLDKALLIPVSGRGSMESATLSYVSPCHVGNSVKLAASYTPAMLDDVGVSARKGYLEDREAFRRNFASFMDEWEKAAPVPPAPLAPILAQPILAQRVTTHVQYPPWFGRRG